MLAAIDTERTLEVPEFRPAGRSAEPGSRTNRTAARVRDLMAERDPRTGLPRVLGTSDAWRDVLEQAVLVAPTTTTVLLLGESGTGKEVVARFVHRASTRDRGPFVAINCGALPDHLLEAELFGYERGAFTGAVQSKPGQIEQAAGGTLFLDEIGELSLAAQTKLLRVLQEREFQRLGGSRTLRSDARIIAATNRDLERAVAQGQFREDLYYRLQVFPIHLPPLRERREDILALTDGFLEAVSRDLVKRPAGISPVAREWLLEHRWPGNARELRNTLERAAILCDGGLITTDHLSCGRVPARVATTSVPSGATRPAVPDTLDLASIERNVIEQALLKARFNKSRAARAVGLTRHQLYIRMRRYGMDLGAGGLTVCSV
jgi:transcriptional regulator with GAF, ATPase, and Fis domain